MKWNKVSSCWCYIFLAFIYTKVIAINFTCFQSACNCDQTRSHYKYTYELREKEKRTRYVCMREYVSVWVCGCGCTQSDSWSSVERLSQNSPARRQNHPSSEKDKLKGSVKENAEESERYWGAQACPRDVLPPFHGQDAVRDLEDDHEEEGQCDKCCPLGLAQDLLEHPKGDDYPEGHKGCVHCWEWQSSAYKVFAVRVFKNDVGAQVVRRWAFCTVEDKHVVHLVQVNG